MAALRAALLSLALATTVFAFAPAVEAKPFCLTPSEGDCDGFVCTKYDQQRRRWTGCAVDRCTLWCPGPYP